MSEKMRQYETWESRRNEIRSGIGTDGRELVPQEEHGSQDPGVGPTKAELLEWLREEAEMLREEWLRAARGGNEDLARYLSGKRDGINSVMAHIRSVEATT